MSYSIDSFWVPRFAGVVPPTSLQTLSGWYAEIDRNTSFIEADLRLRDGWGNLSSPIWFVAAPVGKSTLAKQISACTGAIYLDLANAATVAGNYLTGGIVKSGLLEYWQSGHTTILIDALDEARLRVTDSSFEDFLGDVLSISRGSKLPIVLFGRVGIVEDSWITLEENGIKSPVLDIDFFDGHRAGKFIMATLHRLADLPRNKRLKSALATHRPKFEVAVTEFVKGLEDITASDGARFAGYAPVLEAAATVLSMETNPAKLNDTVRGALQQQVLHTLGDHILEREANKLRNQMRKIYSGSGIDKLYAPNEQLERLSSIVYDTQLPPIALSVPPQHVAAYEAAVNSSLPQHPFLDGTGKNPSGAVFGAVINSNALLSSSADARLAAERHAGSGPYTPNPFLIDYYLESARGKYSDPPFVPPERVVVLYESVQARASVGQVLRLSIDADEDSDEADVEIQIGDANQQIPPRRILIRTSQAGTLKFGRQVNGVSVDAPGLDVIIGAGNPVELVAPVWLNVAKLSFDCSDFVAYKGDHTGQEEDGSVVLEATELAESKVNGAPLVRQGVELSVCWPGASVFPWAQFAGSFSVGHSKDSSHDALNRLRRLVLAFRSHSKGRLARFREKIEHSRMTKGALGVVLRNKLLEDRIISLEGEMYFLDPAALGRIVGATYQDLKMKRFAGKTADYVSNL